MEGWAGASWDYQPGRALKPSDRVYGASERASEPSGSDTEAGGRRGNGGGAGEGT